MVRLVGVSSHRLTSHGLDSQSGHIPMLRVQSPVGERARRQSIDVSFSHQCFSLPLSPPLPKSNEKMSSGEDLRKKEKNSQSKPKLSKPGAGLHAVGSGAMLRIVKE